MKSKTKITKQSRKKGHPILVETILKSKRKESWKRIAEILSMPRRKKIIMNLGEISDLANDGESVLIPGKVLSQGDIKKKIRIISLELSNNAREKLFSSKIGHSSIEEEIKNNPDAKGIRILTK